MASSGHQATTAENGQVAIEAARQLAFDLIVMDVNMPVLDGLSATRTIRADSLNQQTPVVVLSASARAEDHEAGLSAGADAYMNKPIDFRQLAAFMVQAAQGRAALQAISRAIELKDMAA